MTNSIGMLLDIMAVIAALFLVGYSFSLFKLFRGGIMDKPFRIFPIGALAFAIGCVADALGGFQIISYGDDIHHFMMILFVIVTSYALYELHNSWKSISKR